MSRPLPRIDYPTRDSWIIARNKEEAWHYNDAANEIVNHKDHWDGNLQIWGEDMIRDTMNSSKFGVNTPQKNVAARVNIHLHLQAWHGEADYHGLDFDEDWVD